MVYRQQSIFYKGLVMGEFTEEIKIGVREGGPPEEESACTQPQKQARRQSHTLVGGSRAQGWTAT